MRPVARVLAAALFALPVMAAAVQFDVQVYDRTENRILPILAALLVTLIPVLGLFIYLIVRSRETLGEAYRLSWRVRARCLRGTVETPTRLQRCDFQAELDMPDARLGQGSPLPSWQAWELWL